MIAAGQELRRMGLSKKNMYVVPNNLVGQWRNIFLSMYPGAKLLCVEPKKFTPSKREDVLVRIRDEDFDGIIIAYSCFEMIPLSKDFYIDELQSKKSQIENLIKQKSKATSKLRKKKEALEKSLSELVVTIDSMYDSVYFDELGITRLFVDEAHNFKNVPLETKTDMVLGISKGGSKKCRDMMDKVHMIQKKNDGAGVVFATGTPITNSITDAYIMQQYLQSGELAMLDLQNFDSWLGMFAERVTDFEIDVDTNGYRLATRFSKFHNLPELTALIASFADFHGTENTAGVPETDGYLLSNLSKPKHSAGILRYLCSKGWI
jgi:N12 class adenine-specific DNA methylase